MERLHRGILTEETLKVHGGKDLEDIKIEKMCLLFYFRRHNGFKCKRNFSVLIKGNKDLQSKIFFSDKALKNTSFACVSSCLWFL